MIWNVGTWYLGLPASSSHSLIGSIMGVGMANALMSAGHHFGEGVNWTKAQEVGMALLLSPVIGFVASGLLLLLLKFLIRKKELYGFAREEQAAAVVHQDRAFSYLHRGEFRARFK